MNLRRVVTSFDLAVTLATGIFVGYYLRECRCESEASAKLARSVLTVDPSSPGRITDCAGRQWVAMRDDGEGPWAHDCVDFSQ